METCSIEFFHDLFALPLYLSLMKSRTLSSTMNKGSLYELEKRKLILWQIKVVTYFFFTQSKCC